MAISSLSATLYSPLPVFNPSSISSKPKFSSFSLPPFSSLKLRTLKPSHSPVRTYAAAETLDSPEETIGVATDEDGGEASTLSVSMDSEQMAPKQKIRIKLKSYWVPLIEDSCKQIMDAAKNTNAKTMGPVPLPTKKRVYCILKSPHVHKDARFHFEIRTHQRLIDILYPTAQTIDSLMHLVLPAGVDVEVKL